MLPHAPLAADTARDRVETLDDRYNRNSTLITSQLPLDQWHAYLGDRTVADAILDRLVHNSYRLVLKGESMRRQKPSTPKPHPPKPRVIDLKLILNDSSSIASPPARHHPEHWPDMNRNGGEEFCRLSRRRPARNLSVLNARTLHRMPFPQDQNVAMKSTDLPAVNAEMVLDIDLVTYANSPRTMPTSVTLVVPITP